MEARWARKRGVKIEECVVWGKVMAVVDSCYVVEIGMLKEWETISVLLVFMGKMVCEGKRT